MKKKFGYCAESWIIILTPNRIIIKKLDKALQISLASLKNDEKYVSEFICHDSGNFITKDYSDSVLEISRKEAIEKGYNFGGDNFAYKGNITKYTKLSGWWR